MTATNSVRSIAVTGALGNLGGKLLRHLRTLNGISRLVGLDVRVASAHEVEALPGVELIQASVADWGDQRWRAAIAGVDAVVHFAAQNPFPDVTWNDAMISFDMTTNVANAALESRLKRVVFATSNHVMGRYKDEPLWDQVGPGELRPDLPPGVGTVWHSGVRWLDSTTYGASKLMGERTCRAAAARAGGRTTFACVRIGWCQPGENLPATLSAAGAPEETHSAAAADVDPAIIARAHRWFKEMWLSNRDFVQLFTLATLADGAEWPQGYILVNGMSANAGMRWSLDETKRWLAYAPQDGVYRAGAE